MYYLPKIASNSIQTFVAREQQRMQGENSDFIPFLKERDSCGRLIASISKRKSRKRTFRTLTLPNLKPKLNIFGEPSMETINEGKGLRGSAFNYNKLSKDLLLITKDVSITHTPEMSPLLKKPRKSPFYFAKEEEGDEKKGATVVEDKSFMKKLNRGLKSFDLKPFENHNEKSVSVRHRAPQVVKEKYIESIEERYKFFSRFLPGLKPLEKNVGGNLKELNRKFKALQKKIAVSSYDYESNIRKFIREHNI